MNQGRATRGVLACSRSASRRAIPLLESARHVRCCWKFSEERSFAASAARRELPPPLEVSPAAAKFFYAVIAARNSKMLEEDPVVGIRLDMSQSQDTLRLRFTFDFVKQGDVKEREEFAEFESHRLFVAERALMKVLGTTVDISPDSGMPVVLDSGGHVLDPMY